MVSRFLKIFENKKNILIVGYGREGSSSYRFIRKLLPDIQVGIADHDSKILNNNDLITDSNCILYTGENYLQNIDDFDLIVKSPGVKIKVVKDESKITSQTDMFLSVFANQTIGVTGTKGKSTTASMIDHILKKSGRSTHLIGNIGVPAFEVVQRINPSDIIVYELSAHQLECLKHPPHIAVILNIFPEHLDYFTDFEAYRKAKLNICNAQNTCDHIFLTKPLEPEITNLKASMHMVNSIPGNDTSIIPVRGIHNRINCEFAIEVTSLFDISRNDAINYLSGFKSLPHRLEFLGIFGGVSFINDSISTIPESAIAAVNSLEKVDIIILGGYDRGLDYSALCDFLIKSGIRSFFFLGNAGKRMLSLMTNKTDASLIMSENLEGLFKDLSLIAKHGDICLLSPAAASYDQFRNFEHRGDLFKELAGSFVTTHNI